VTDANLQQFLHSLRRSLDDGDFVKLTLAKHRGKESDLKNLYVRPVALKRGERLSFLYRFKTKDVVKNFDADEGVRLVSEHLGSEFLSGHLFTTHEDLQIDFNRKGESRLTARAATFDTPQTTTHDRKRQRLLETAGNVYLHALGVTNERGEVRPAMGDKLRQINKFVETVGGLYAASSLKARDELSVFDMGSGKGYLTFAVYDYFVNTLGLRATVAGIEAREDLVELCNDVALRAGFDRLSFSAGFIQDFELPHTDILIALHACDTATDDAIFKGIRAGASVIITAPCCHKELRPQIRTPGALRGVLRHGILLEREAEAVTDSLRALLLEHAGYGVKVFEFISTEHTRKNTMIAAVRKSSADGNETSAVADNEKSLREFRELKEFYGIREQRLEKLLCEI
jgi:hypothetical protein